MSLLTYSYVTQFSSSVNRNYFCSLQVDQKHKKLQRTFFNQTKQDRMQIFEGIFFKATKNTKTNKSASWVLSEACAFCAYIISVHVRMGVCELKTLRHWAHYKCTLLLLLLLPVYLFHLNWYLTLRCHRMSPRFQHKGSKGPEVFSVVRNTEVIGWLKFHNVWSSTRLTKFTFSK